MGKADNTRLELEKLRLVYEELASHDVKDKESFINYWKQQNT